MKVLRSKRIRFLGFVSVLIITLCFSLIFSNNYNFAKAVESIEQKIYCKATLEDNFADDKVIIVLNKEATRQFRTYTPEDFPEIECSSVDDLTHFTVDYARKKIRGEKTEKSMLVNVEEFRRILSLELKEKSKENVLKAIKQLEKRNDILSAEPNSVLTICATPNDPSFINGGQWGLNKINAPSAWEITKGTNTITVGVLDSGIESTHPDLRSASDQARNSLKAHFGRTN